MRRNLLDSFRWFHDGFSYLTRCAEITSGACSNDAFSNQLMPCFIFLAPVCQSASLYENLFNIAVATYSIRGIRHSFRSKNATGNGARDKQGRQHAEDLPEEEEDFFDSKKSCCAEHVVLADE